MLVVALQTPRTRRPRISTTSKAMKSAPVLVLASGNLTSTLAAPTGDKNTLSASASHGEQLQKIHESHVSDAIAKEDLSNSREPAAANVVIDSKPQVEVFDPFKDDPDAAKDAKGRLPTDAQDAAQKWCPTL